MVDCAHTHTVRILAYVKCTSCGEVWAQPRHDPNCPDCEFGTQHRNPPMQEATAMNQLHGAAAHSLANKLLMEPYEFDDWDAAHERIADWHIDSKGHRVCGCEIHQAHCPDCHAPWIAAYEEEIRRGNL